MKRLFLVLMLLVFAGSVFAAELKVSGDANVRGTTYGNKDLAKDKEATYSYFDYDLNVNMAFVVNEKATVFTKLTFDKDVKGSGLIADGSASAEDPGLAVERAYINYKFAPFLQLNTGLMAGGQWASAFNDNESNVMRVQFIGALSQDLIFVATYEKQDEQGTNAKGGITKDAEKDDTNAYYLASQLKFGPVTVLPLFTYVTKGINHSRTQLKGIYTDNSATIEATMEDSIAALMNVYGFTEAQAMSYIATGGLTTGVTGLTMQDLVDGAITKAVGENKKYDLSIMAFTLGLNGDFGMVGFESEFVVKKTDLDGFDKDHALLASAAKLYDGKQYGAYVNLFAKIDPAKVGFVYAYGSSDEKEGSFNWGDDLDLFVVVDDAISNVEGDNGLTGFTAYKIYADAAFGKFFAGVAAGMGESNIKNDKSAFVEYDAKVGYNFDENTTYTIAGGFAQLEKWGGKTYDCDAYRVYHKFAVKF